ncbi:MAG: hypothetical protein ACI8UP_003810, partial [Porticoccaceae bacterium]
MIGSGFWWRSAYVTSVIDDKQRPTLLLAGYLLA